MQCRTQPHPSCCPAASASATLSASGVLSPLPFTEGGVAADGAAGCNQALVHKTCTGSFVMGSVVNLDKHRLLPWGEVAAQLQHFLECERKILQRKQVQQKVGSQNPINPSSANPAGGLNQHECAHGARTASRETQGHNLGIRPNHWRTAKRRFLACATSMM
jgi:hypothetical protein